MREELVLSIEGMHCGACARRVSAALEKTEGVQVSSVEVGSARVTYQPERITAEEIAGAVSRIGFVARKER